MKNLGEILASPTLTRGSRSPCSMVRPSRRPAAIRASLRRRKAGDAWLGRCSKVWMRSNWMRWSIGRGTTRLAIIALNSPHDKSAAKRQSLETKPISRGTESSNPVPSSGESHCEPAGHPLKGSRPKPRRVRAPASAIRRRAGTNRAASWPRSGGIRASCTRASASSSPICPAGRTGRRSRPQGCRHRAARRSFRQPGRSRRPDPAQRRHPENPSRPEDRLSAQLGRREGAPRRRRPALTGAGKDRPRGESCGRCAAAAYQPGASQSPGSAKGMRAFALTMRPMPSRVCQPRSLPDVPSLRESRRNIAGRNHRDRQPRPLCLPHTHRDNRFWSRHSEP